MSQSHSGHICLQYNERQIRLMMSALIDQTCNACYYLTCDLQLEQAVGILTANTQNNIKEQQSLGVNPPLGGLFIQSTGRK